MKLMKTLISVLMTLAGLVTCGLAQVETYEWMNFSGKPGGSGSSDGAANDAQFTRPSGITLDRYGNTYVADSYNYTVRKITPNGVVSTMAGKAGVPGKIDGIREEARFYTPTDVAVDDNGNVFVTDFTNNLIRKITPDGVVSVYAGDPINASGTTDGPRATARFSWPAGIAIDTAGNLFIADSSNNSIRKISADGIVSTVAGLAGYSGGFKDGTGSGAYFNTPSDVAVAPDGVLYVADTFNRAVRKITPEGVVTTLPGTGLSTSFPFPLGITVDNERNVYVSTGSTYVYQPVSTDIVMKITPDGTISTLAGMAGVPTSHADGTGSAARFFRPSGLAMDPNGDLLVADTLNHALRKITPNGVVTSPIGAPPTAAMVNGVFSAARYSRPNSLVSYRSNLFVADTDNCVIRKITANGNASTFAGTAGVPGKVEGAVGTGKFTYPEGVAVDASGNLYVADTGIHSIRKTNTSGVISNVSGGIYGGSTNGSLSNASFRNPSRLVVDASNNIYVADRRNFIIRKITSTLVSTLVAGPAINTPNGLVMGSDGNLRLADTGKHAISQITPGGDVTTLAGGTYVLSTPQSGTADGTGSDAQFNGPFDLAYDSDGNLIVVDTANNTIRKVTPSGVVTTIGGTPGVVGGAGGIGPAGLFSGPRGVTTIGSDIYISDTGNNRIVKGMKKGFRPLLDRSEITDLGIDTATLHGTVNPNGSATIASFEYGISASLGSAAAVSIIPGDDLATQTVSVTLNGLTPGSAYFYRLTATNTAGTAFTRMGHFILPTPIIEVESPETQTLDGVLSLDFETAGLDQTESQTIFVKNPGNVPLEVHSIGMVGDNPGDFEIDAPSTAMIAPGGSVAMEVRFAPAAEGSRRAVFRVASNDPAKPTVDVALIGVGLSPAESWRKLYFQQTAATGDAADSADPDHDGLSNLIERAFNLHPLQSGTATLVPGSGTAGLPVGSLIGAENARRLCVEFIRRIGHPEPGMSYQAQFSDQPDAAGSWRASTKAESVTPIDDDWERVIIEDDQAGALRRFARVRIISGE